MYVNVVIYEYSTLYNSSMTNNILLLKSTIFHIWFCSIMFILLHTMLYLYNFPCMLPLRCSHTTYIVSLSWYSHPCLYNSANSIPSAENAIPQTVETPLIIHSPTQVPQTAKCLHLINPHTILFVLLLVALVKFLDILVCIGTIFSSPTNFRKLIAELYLTHFWMFSKPRAEF